MTVEQEVRALMIWPNDRENPDFLTIEAYKAVATCMMAEYNWSPIRKLGYFREGTRALDSLIEQDRNVESVYLRLLIQLKAPDILNYNRHMEEDLAFYRENLPNAGIGEDYKEFMVLNLNKLLADREKLELALVLNN